MSFDVANCDIKEGCEMTRLKVTICDFQFDYPQIADHDGRGNMNP